MSEKKLSKEAQIARAAYKREWSKKNPEKNKEYMARYWQRKAEEAVRKNTENTPNE